MTCTIEIDGFGGPEFCRERMVKARKTHKCYECHRLIAPGEVYEYTIGKWEGEFRVFKTCPDCLSLRDEFFCSWNYGCIWEDFDETLSNGAWETYGERLAGLTEFARAKAAELIEDYWEQDGDIKEVMEKREKERDFMTVEEMREQDKYWGL